MQSKHFANRGNAPCSCDWVQARIWDYLDGTLNIADREQLQAHNTACPACERELQAARRSEIALSGAVGMAPAAGDLRAGFYAKLAASEAKPRPSRRFGWAIAVPALAAGLLAVVLWRPVSVHNAPGEHLPVDKSTAAMPRPVKPPIAQTDVSRHIVVKNITPLHAQNLPSAVSNSPSPERLKLSKPALIVRLTPQEIRRMRNAGLVRADISDWRLHFDSRQAAPLGFADFQSDHFNETSGIVREPTFAYRAVPFSGEMSLSYRETAGRLNEADINTTMSNGVALGIESRQNVQKLAFATSTEMDSESYLEVDDDTRNFSYSARHASLQDSDGGEIELSVSGDKPDSNPEGAGTE